MIDAILLDLDNTLLGNSMRTFIPRYFALLGRYAQKYMDEEAFIQMLLASTDATVRNTDTAVSNQQAFWQDFEERSGLDAAELEAYFDNFYRSDFHQLQQVTQRLPAAVDLVRACFAQDLKVVVATNPLFPRPAIEARLAWAGVPVTDYDYALVTTYETMHATKPHEAYYREILDKIDVRPERALMVGDDWENDVVPAAAVGLATYWIQPSGSAAPDPTLPTACGSLEELHDKIQSGWLLQLV